VEGAEPAAAVAEEGAPKAGGVYVCMCVCVCVYTFSHMYIFMHLQCP
jgi:hypothetical protein